MIRLEGITKVFPGVKSLDGVDFEAKSGEIHALLGENGAGKSTLIKTMAGAYIPEEGSIRFDGQDRRWASPKEAKDAGIHIIYQELMLFPELTVAENIFIGEAPKTRYGFIDYPTMFARAQETLDRLGHHLDPQALVKDLSVADQQMVEIAKALVGETKLLVLDEPTAVISGREAELLFERVKRLRDEGVCIIYISHRMEEIFKITDRITVLRDGQHRGTLNTADTDEDEITQLMIGRALDLSRNVSLHELGDVALEVKGLGCAGLFNNVSFKVRRGEVVGFYSLVGAGRTEIAETLFGLREPTAGKILLDGNETRISSPVDAIANGISLVPEDRKGQGLILGMNCRDNMTLPQVDDLTAGPFVAPGEEVDIFDRYKDRLDIRPPSWRQQAKNLSGGNQQKIVIGKWLAMKPKILIVDEPTRGIDIGSKSEIHNLIRELAAQGYAVIVISSEMPEVLHVSDRIIAMYHGEISRTFTTDEVTEDNLIQAISGLTEVKAA